MCFIFNLKIVYLSSPNMKIVTQYLSNLKKPTISLFVALGVLFFGSLVGYYRAIWQTILEPAMVIAGKVKWDSITFDMQNGVEAWSLAVQVTAGLLALNLPGVNEQTLSVFISSLLTGITFLSIYSFSYSLSKSRTVSLGILCVLTLTQLYRWGVNYPVEIFFYSHTLGLLGLVVVIMIVSLLISKKHISAAFMLGLLPSIHVSWFILLFPVLGIYYLIERKRLTINFKKAILFFGLGSLISVLSYGLHVWINSRYHLISSQLSAKEFELIFRSFAHYFDGHRTHVVFRTPGTSMVFLSALGYGLIVFAFARQKIFNSTWRASLILFLFSSYAVVITFLTHLPFEWQPTLFLFPIPGRVLCFPILFFVPAILALTFQFESRKILKIGTPLTLLAFVFLFLNVRSLPPNPWQVPSNGLYFLVALLITIIVFEYFEKPKVTQYFLKLVVFLGVLTSIWSSYQFFQTGVVQSELKNFRNDTFWNRVHQDPGPILVASDTLFLQYRTERPIVINGWNSILYSPKMAGQATLALKEIYHMDVYEGAHGDADAQTSSFYQIVFTNRSTKEWISLSKKYGFSNVMAKNKYPLQLPLLATNQDFSYYRLP